jgi:hypothetical protein
VQQPICVHRHPVPGAVAGAVQLRGQLRTGRLRQERVGHPAVCAHTALDVTLQ